MSQDDALLSMRAEPNPWRISLIDLTWLVVGTAITVSLHRSNWWPDYYGTTPRTFWMVSLDLIRVNSERACLAIAPAVIARRARRGGHFLAVEFYGLIVAMINFVNQIDRWLLPIFSTGLAFPKLYSRFGIDDHHVYFIAKSFVALVAGLTLVSVRRRAPRWITGLLLIVVWSGLLGPFHTIAELIVRSILGPAPDKTVAIRRLILQIPLGIVWSIPIVLALIRLIRGQWAGWGWSGWSCLCLGLLNWLSLVVPSTINELSSGVGWTLERAFNFISVYLGMLGAAVLIRLFEPAARRWFEPVDRGLLATIGPEVMMGSSPQE